MAFVAWMSISILINAAVAHEANNGRWSYDAFCCADRDCREAREGEVTFTPDGWRIVPTKEILTMSDRRILDSQDHHIHICQYRDSNTAQLRTRCLYLPQAQT